MTFLDALKGEPQEPLEYVVAESRGTPGEWRAEASDNDGECFVVLFCGPDAEERAREYVLLLNAKPELLALLEAADRAAFISTSGKLRAALDALDAKARA